MAKLSRHSEQGYDIELIAEKCGGRHHAILAAAREARRIVKVKGFEYSNRAAVDALINIQNDVITTIEDIQK